MPEIIYIILLIIFSFSSTIAILMVLKQEKKNIEISEIIKTLEKRSEILVRVTAKHEDYFDTLKKKAEEMEIRRKGKVR